MLFYFFFSNNNTNKLKFLTSTQMIEFSCSLENIQQSQSQLLSDICHIIAHHAYFIHRQHRYIAQVRATIVAKYLTTNIFADGCCAIKFVTSCWFPISSWHNRLHVQLPWTKRQPFVFDVEKHVFALPNTARIKRLNTGNKSRMIYISACKKTE